MASNAILTANTIFQCLYSDAMLSLIISDRYPQSLLAPCQRTEKWTYAKRFLFRVVKKGSFYAENYWELIKNWNVIMGEPYYGPWKEFFDQIGMMGCWIHRSWQQTGPARSSGRVCFRCVRQRRCVRTHQFSGIKETPNGPLHCRKPLLENRCEWFLVLKDQTCWH